MIRSYKKLIVSLLVLALLAGIIGLAMPALAQVDEIVWQPEINLSNSASTSTDPFLLSDPAGRVHLFWAEKLGEAVGNSPDTILYTYWDGNSWAQPSDIQFAPLSDGNPIIGYPDAVIDSSGDIHLIWQQQPNFPNYSLYYSTAHSWEAAYATAWSQPRILAPDLTGTKYSIAIAFREPDEIHVVYARGNTSPNPGERRAVTYLVSKDGGENWSQPVDIYQSVDIIRGASDTNLLLEDPDRIYVSWTEWDDTGNGQVVYFSRSLDNGATWEAPIALAKRYGLEYERDWNSLALIGENQLVSIWEGGWRAYRHVMYSSDAGETWTDPVDAFPYLIGDNGAVQFVKDGDGRLHCFVASRVREGILDRPDVQGLWHSVLEQGRRWREPLLMAQSDGITNPHVAIVNGNRIVAVWYESQVYDIIAKTGTIESASFIPSVDWPKPANVAEPSPTPSATPTLAAAAAVVTPLPEQSDPGGRVQTVSTGTYLILGIIPALMIIAALVVWQRLRHSRAA